MGTGEEGGYALRRTESTSHVSPTRDWLQGGLSHRIAGAQERLCEIAAGEAGEGPGKQGSLIVTTLAASSRSRRYGHACARFPFHLGR